MSWWWQWDRRWPEAIPRVLLHFLELFSTDYRLLFGVHSRTMWRRRSLAHYCDLVNRCDSFVQLPRTLLEDVDLHRVHWLEALGRLLRAICGDMELLPSLLLGLFRELLRCHWGESRDLWLIWLTSEECPGFLWCLLLKVDGHLELRLLIQVWCDILGSECPVDLRL